MMTSNQETRGIRNNARLERRDSIIEITEDSTIRSRVPNENVLAAALNLGLLLPGYYNFMIVIGKSIRVGQLMRDVSIPSLDAIAIVLRSMQRRGLIEIL